jgi:hypothetical protein
MRPSLLRGQSFDRTCCGNRVQITVQLVDAATDK